MKFGKNKKKKGQASKIIYIFWVNTKSCHVEEANAIAQSERFRCWHV